MPRTDGTSGRTHTSSLLMICSAPRMISYARSWRLWRRRLSSTWPSPHNDRRSPSARHCCTIWKAVSTWRASPRKRTNWHARQILLRSNPTPPSPMVMPVWRSSTSSVTVGAGRRLARTKRWLKRVTLHKRRWQSPRTTMTDTRRWPMCTWKRMTSNAQLPLPSVH